MLELESWVEVAMLTQEALCPAFPGVLALLCVSALPNSASHGCFGCRVGDLLWPGQATHQVGVLSRADGTAV